MLIFIPGRPRFRRVLGSGSASRQASRFASPQYDEALARCSQSSIVGPSTVQQHAAFQRVWLAVAEIAVLAALASTRMTSAQR